MSAKRPQTSEARALRAFVAGWITRREYIACLRFEMRVTGRTLMRWREGSFGQVDFAGWEIERWPLRADFPDAGKMVTP